MTARAYISGSAMPQVAKCAPSGVLPRVLRIGDKDRIGSALHEHMADRPKLGIAGAVARLEEIALAWDLDEREASIFMARARSFEWSPPRASLCEKALCLLEDGTVVEVEGGRGSYSQLPPGALLPTQIDVIWSEPQPLYRDTAGRIRCPQGSTLWVGDYKSGLEQYVDPVEKNLQLITGCVLAAKYVGATAAIPAAIFIRKGRGLWDVPEHALDEAGLVEAEALLRAVLANVDEQRRRLAAGEPLTFVEGSHCTFCDSRTYCSAKIASLKSYLDDPQPLSAEQLTAAQATRLAEMLPQIENFADHARAALVAYTNARGPVKVSAPGKLWGPNPHERTVVDPAIAVAVLAEELGDVDAARAILKAEVSKSAIETAIKEQHAALGITRKVSAAMRRVLGKIGEQGGLRKEITTWYSMFAGEEQAPPGAPQLAPGPRVVDEREIDGDAP